jgi:acetyl-CoA acetyltransferase
MRDVYIVAVGMMPFGKYPDQQIKQLTAAAMQRLEADSPIPAEQIEAAWMSNSGWGMNTGQHCIRGQVALAPLGFEGIPVMNVENACAGGSSALHGAFLGVASGAYDVALAVGAEKLSVPSDAGAEAKEAGFRSFIAGTDVEVTTELIAQLQAEAERKRAEAEAAGGSRSSGKGGGRSPFMDIYSMGARAHMVRDPGTAGGDSGQEPPSRLAQPRRPVPLRHDTPGGDGRPSCLVPPHPRHVCPHG